MIDRAMIDTVTLWLLPVLVSRVAGVLEAASERTVCARCTGPPSLRASLSARLVLPDTQRHVAPCWTAPRILQRKDTRKDRQAIPIRLSVIVTMMMKMSMHVMRRNAMGCDGQTRE